MENQIMQQDFKGINTKSAITPGQDRTATGNPTVSVGVPPVTPMTLRADEAHRAYEIELKVLRPKLKEFGLPQYGSDAAAGMDLFACHDEPIVLKPGATHFFPTGISIFMGNRNLCALILSRSGLGTKKGLVVKQGVGLIDADYQGEIIVALQNVDTEERSVLPGERIAQIMFTPVLHPKFVEVENFSDTTTRGAGGFGSTGGHS